MKVFLLSFFIALFPLTIFPSSDNYLVEIGKIFLEKGYTQAAKTEFEEALAINPSNEKANMYLSQIRKDRMNSALDVLERPLKDVEEVATPVKKDYFALPPGLQSSEEERPLKRKPRAEKDSDFTFKGEYQLSFGIEGGDVLWKRANADLNEENWRLLDDKAHNRREKTFDPAVYSRLQFEVDFPREQGWGFHSNFDISPWSFVGKSEKTTITSAGGDTADIQLKYWANTRHTVNETIYSLLGNSFALPEVKVTDSKVPSFTTPGFFAGADPFTVPELKIHREFQPLRELWFDYNSDNLAFRIFPAGLENLSYSSDDPLGLTNHHIYWEESQWLVNWYPGGLSSPGFKKGWWNDSLAYFTRDSTGTRLTSLRGFSLSLSSEKSSLDFTTASPKELWQDYDSFNTFQNALRGKYFWADDLTLGFVYGSKFGYDKRALDAFNHFLGFDVNLGLGPNTELFLQTAASRTEQDRQSDYETEKRGNSFHLSLINSSSQVFGKDYFSIISGKEEPFYKLKLSLTHMDRGFESALASFRETRDDSFWSRHLSFREPFDYYSPGLYEPGLGWDEVKVFRVGDGIDYGRDVVNFRWETENFIGDKLDTLVDIRNVHNTKGKFIENVARLEFVYQATEKLTTKFLGLRHDLPKTKEGYDPFLIDPNTDDFYENSSIEEGKDPTLQTISTGAKYDFFDWLDLSFIWEHTNDSTLAYDNFPRRLFHFTNLTSFTEYGQPFNKEKFVLEHPGSFPLPPYSYFNIFKVGIGLKPKDNLEIYLDYTHNEYEWSQIIDDNMNHIGLEVSYLPAEKLGLYLRYVYSRANDISELDQYSQVARNSHHTIFSELKLRIEDDSELVAQYGVGNIGSIANTVSTPFGGGVATLDTQHIVRVYYRKKF